jgi:hypothetical protein
LDGGFDMKNIFDGITADELRLYMEHVKEEEIGDRQLRYLAERGNLIGYDKAEACRQAPVNLIILQIKKHLTY